jgi:outer membrane protein
VNARAPAFVLRPMESAMIRSLLVVAALVLPVAAHAAGEAPKIGVVDLQRALNEVEEGAKAKAALKKEFDEKQKALDARQNELKAMKDELDARGSMMKPEAKQERVAELQKKLLEVQQLYFQMQQELTKKEADATGEIFKKMGTILSTMGQQDGFDLIVEKSAVLYSKNHLDLTNELIRRYNDAYGKKASGATSKK